MTRSLVMAGSLMALTSGAFAGGFPSSAIKKCASDAVVAGTVCMDKYEASVWRVPNPTTTNALLVKKILMGKATAVDLTAAGGMPLGTASDDYAPCGDSGQDCAGDIYAVSIPGVIPSAYITWFQAQEACANAGKRLPTNAEWQVAANGSPDPGGDNGSTDCNTASIGTAGPTGSRSGCVSARGAFDMVGNLNEWVADWVPRSTGCPGWGGFSDDNMCLSGASTTDAPGALVRGGDGAAGSGAGPLNVGALNRASGDNPTWIGFRCAR